MREILLNKGYSEKEIEILSGSQKLNTESDVEIGRYQLQLVQAFGHRAEYGDHEYYPIIIVLDTKTGHCYELYSTTWDINSRKWKSKKIKIIK